MKKKSRTLLLYAIGFVFLGSLLVWVYSFHNKEQSFQDAYPHTPLNYLSVVLEYPHQGNSIWFYESITVTIQNDSTESITLDTDTVRLLTYQALATNWIEVPYRILSSPMPGQNNISILNQGEATTLTLLPEYGKRVKKEHFRLVILGSLVSIDQLDRKVGGYLDIPVTPAPDMDFSLLSMKNHYPQIYKLARQWRDDVYLTRFDIDIPRKENQGGTVASYTFQSPTEENSQINIGIDVYGRTHTSTETFGGGVDRLLPIQSDEWVLDGPEVLTLLMQYDQDIQWPGNQCDGLVLRHPFLGPLEWAFYTADCSMKLEYLYVVDPITGSITEK